MAAPTCRWVLTPASKGVQPVYCEKKVRYRTVHDDDGNPYRKYQTFCPDHMEAAKQYAKDYNERDEKELEDYA